MRRIRVVHNDIVWYGKRPGFSHGPFSGPSLWFRLSLLIDAYERKFDKEFDRTLIDPALLLK